MIMAAGLGTRLRPFTELTPKPALPLMGISLLELVVDQLASAGVCEVVINVHHRAEVLIDIIYQLKNKYPRINFLISDESSLLLGSAGGLKLGANLLFPKGEGSFYWVNADTLSNLNLNKLAEQHFLPDASHCEMTLAIQSLNQSTRSYREAIIDQYSGLITGWGSLVPNKPYFNGVAVLSTAALSHLKAGEPADFFENVLKLKTAQRKVNSHFVSGFWLDIGTPQAWAEAHFILMDILKKGLLPEHWQTLLLANNCEVKTQNGQTAWRFNFKEMGSMAIDGPAYVGRLTQAVNRPVGKNTILYLNTAEEFLGTPLENRIFFNGLSSPLN